MMDTQHKGLIWAGRVITGLIGLLMAFSGTMKLMNPPAVVEQFVGKFGYPADVTIAIGIVELACVVLYLIPATSILGAVLLTGYLGGAIATHVRVHDSFVAPAIIGIVAWLGVYLRDPRIRALLPLRRSSTSIPTSS
jgi:uncharacterized membrane protein YphA (DoxX/SURF4 family)